MAHIEAATVDWVRRVLTGSDDAWESSLPDEVVRSAVCTWAERLERRKDVKRFVRRRGGVGAGRDIASKRAGGLALTQ